MTIHPHVEIYPASRIRRSRATNAEMEQRAEFLIEYAKRHGPVTVRQLYYQAEVHGLSGIDKTDAGYNKVQTQVLKLRRAGRMRYDWIADATRWMRKPRSFDSIEDALASTARTYRRNLWRDTEAYVEIWCEKDALAGVIYPVTSAHDVPLMVTRGFSSETFCYEAVDARSDDQRPYVVYYLGDFDRAGRDAERSLNEKLTRFASASGLAVQFHSLAVTEQQVRDLRLPTRAHKRTSASDKKWPHEWACELDAIPPDTLRAMVEGAIARHIDHEELKRLRTVEASERLLLKAWRGSGGSA